MIRPKSEPGFRASRNQHACDGSSPFCRRHSTYRWISDCSPAADLIGFRAAHPDGLDVKVVEPLTSVPGRASRRLNVE